MWLVVTGEEQMDLVFTDCEGDACGQDRRRNKKGVSG